VSDEMAGVASALVVGDLHCGEGKRGAQPRVALGCGVRFGGFWDAFYFIDNRV
jgi:hypothetical protein